MSTQSGGERSKINNPTQLCEAKYSFHMQVNDFKVYVLHSQFQVPHPFVSQNYHDRASWEPHSRSGNVPSPTEEIRKWTSTFGWLWSWARPLMDLVLCSTCSSSHPPCTVRCWVDLTGKDLERSSWVWFIRVLVILHQRSVQVSCQRCGWHLFSDPLLVESWGNG